MRKDIYTKAQDWLRKTEQNLLHEKALAEKEEREGKDTVHQTRYVLGIVAYDSGIDLLAELGLLRPDEK